MGIKYFCDVCAREYNVKGGFGPTGYPSAMETMPDSWAVVSVLGPKLCEHQAKGPVYPYPSRAPQGFLVCSQACAEKALDEAKELLRPAFEGLSD